MIQQDPNCSKKEKLAEWKAAFLLTIADAQNWPSWVSKARLPESKAEMVDQRPLEKCFKSTWSLTWGYTKSPKEV